MRNRRPITRIRPPESSAHTTFLTSGFDAWSGSEKARSSASDLISASGSERIWSSAPYTYRDSAAGSLSWRQESGGAGQDPPRSRNRWVPSCRPTQERYRVALWGRPVITGFGGGAEPPKDRGWERERVSNQSYALPGSLSEDATGCSRHRSRDRRGAS